MSALSKNYNAIVGDSSEIKKWLENTTKKNLVYKATAPNGKSYIGQTSKTLEERKMGHIYSATSKYNRNEENSLFHKALLKYKDEVTWEILENNLSNIEANLSEQRYIKESNSIENGYNQTTGGKSLFSHSEKTKKLIADKAGVHSKLHWDDARKIAAAATMQEQWKDTELCEKRSIAIKSARSTDEQRKATSENATKRYSDPVKRNEMAIACGGKQFEVYKDGVLVGTWTNAAQCAKDLNFATKTHISNCLHGRRNSYLKYTFKYS
jgi:hypothetical protein